MDLDQPYLESVRAAKTGGPFALAEVERVERSSRAARFGGGKRRVEIADPERGHDPRRAGKQGDMRMFEHRLVMLGDLSVAGGRERQADWSR
jgi:hypothetical protein